MNWNETLTVKTYEYHGLLKENKELKEKLAQRDEEIRKLKEENSRRKNAK
jgi:hypothetical protein